MALGKKDKEAQISEFFGLVGDPTFEIANDIGRAFYRRSDRLHEIRRVRRFLHRTFRSAAHSRVAHARHFRRSLGGRLL